MKLNLALVISFLFCSFLSVGQNTTKSHFLIENTTTSLEFEMLQKAANNYYSFSELRFLNERRTIEIIGSDATIILYSANELFELYNKPISSATIQINSTFDNVMFSLTDSKTPVFTKHILNN